MPMADTPTYDDLTAPADYKHWFNIGFELAQHRPARAETVENTLRALPDKDADLRLQGFSDGRTAFHKELTRGPQKSSPDKQVDKAPRKTVEKSPPAPPEKDR